MKDINIYNTNVRFIIICNVITKTYTFISSTYKKLCISKFAMQYVPTFQIISNTNDIFNFKQKVPPLLKKKC